MKISFYGACGEVTGSNYLIETNSGKKILLECGLFQGDEATEEKNFREFPYYPSEIDAVIITHSHIDHIGLLPKLYSKGFVGKIYTTDPTADFAKIFLEDAQKIQENNLATKNKYGILYSLSDVFGVLGHFITKPYYQEFEVADGVKVKFYDAGHILGSAIVELNFKDPSSPSGQVRLVFSGDLGNPPVPILRDTDFIPSADYVIMESTYGNRLHEPVKERTRILKSLIKETIKKKGVLLIPSFAMERAQEIIYEINEMIVDKQIPQIPVYLDSPLAIKATRIYPKYERYFNKKSKEKIKLGKDILNFPSLKICETSEQSKQIRHQIGPKVIMAGSGMSTGGRILFHERDFLPNPYTILAIVGFQVNGTLGRDLIEGAKRVEILGNKINVNAKVVSIDSYSAHGDYNDILFWLSKVKGVKKVILVHGEEEARQNLANLIQSKLDVETIMPKEQDSINF